VTATATKVNPSRAFVDQARVFLRDEYLPKIKRCLEPLTDEQIWWRPNEESNSIGNLLLHLCGNARQWICSGLGGQNDSRYRQAEFDQRELIPRAELLENLEATIRDVDRTLAEFDSEKLLDTYVIQSSDVTALEAIFHVTEHFSMHTGQIILLTKMLTSSSLQFYNFVNGKPVHMWKELQTD
jgi:uncharacterized damage-inducible protein DinB